MDPAARSLIEALFRSDLRCVVAVTGGGATAGGMLLGVPGASRTVVEFVVPYHEDALADFLGRRPGQYCSVETAALLAARAHARCRWLVPDGRAVGVGCTASLATNRPKRGDHRVHVAVQDDLGRTSWGLTLEKGARDREGEEAVAAALVLNALAEAAGLGERLPIPLRVGERVETASEAAGVLASLLRAERPAVCVETDGRLTVDGPPPATLVPGAFNPVHLGHWRLVECAVQAAGGPAALELSVVNVDKPALAPGEVRRRLAQVAGRVPVWVTRAPTFREKAALFPGVLFVVGVDTAERIVAARYYGGSEAGMTAALEEIRRQRCRFLVAPRHAADGRLLGLEDLAVPTAFRDLFQAISKDQFCVPVSSTRLRGARQATAVAGSGEGE